MLDHLSVAGLGSPVSSALAQVAGPGAFARALDLLCALRPSLESLGLIHTLLAGRPEDWSRAPAAYRHDNGYIKLPLLRSAQSGATIRLNIWLPGLANMENIHDHRWDYASFVLCGHLSEQQYCGSTAGFACNWFQYTPRGSSASYELTRRGERKLALLQEERIVARRYYVRPHCVLHAVAPDAARLTATLQITFNPIASGCSNVFSKENLTAGGARVPSPALASEARTSALGRLAAALTEA